jgi:hypothetical protein
VTSLLVLLCAPRASAQIKEPGNHPKYGVEFEPHFLAQWSGPYWGDAGIGAGLRVSIPIIDDGPVTTINNSFAIGFGFDWAHFGGGCWDWGRLRPPGPPPPPPGPDLRGYDCNGNSFWFPAVRRPAILRGPALRPQRRGCHHAAHRMAVRVGGRVVLAVNRGKPRRRQSRDRSSAFLAENSSSESTPF